MKFITVLCAVLFSSFGAAEAFPIKSQSYVLVDSNRCFRLLSQRADFIGLREVADNLLARARPRSLFHLQLGFQGVPTYELAVTEVEQALREQFREARIYSLETAEIPSHAYTVLDNIIPSINHTDLKGLTAEIQDWYLSDENSHLVLRIEPGTRWSPHALVLVSIEGDRAQALVIEISSPEAPKE